MKYILQILTISSLIVLAGCASDPASVNTNSGNTEVQKQNENTEVVVANTNDNTNVNTNVVGTALELSENTADTEVDLSSEALAQEDTSDWLTYTNEEYGFSFKYPEEWGNAEEEKGAVRGSGSKSYITFSNDINKGIDNTENLPQINITSSDYSEIHEGDVPAPINMNEIDLTLNEIDLEKYFLNASVNNADVEKYSVDGIKILKVLEDGQSMAGKYNDNLKYYIPYVQQSGAYNLLVLSSGTDHVLINDFVNSFDF